jgi:hypothetical protein
MRRANAAVKTPGHLPRASQGSTRWKLPRQVAEIKEVGEHRAKAPIATSWYLDGPLCGEESAARIYQNCQNARQVIAGRRGKI